MTPLATTPELTLAERIILFTLGITSLLLVVVARSLEPDSRGFGTHEQLGLSPCVIQQWTGYPCPACGATTAWAHALRGDLAQAVVANLGGSILLGLVLLGIPWTLISAIRNRWLIARPAPKHLLVTATACLMVILLDWLRRCFMN